MGAERDGKFLGADYYMGSEGIRYIVVAEGGRKFVGEIIIWVERGLVSLFLCVEGDVKFVGVDFYMS